MSSSAACRVVCVTGASSGIGHATAAWFAAQGDHIVVGARRLERLKSHEAELLALGAASVLSLELDVRSQASIETFCQSVNDKYAQGCDVLVNNAGLALGRDSVAKGQDADWLGMVETNVIGLLRMTREVLKGMLPRKSGHIVMIGSIAGHQVYEGGSVYSATKFGVKAITETLKLELNGTGIRVTTIDPGMVETEFSIVRFHQDPSKADGVYKGMTPLSGNDVAACIGFAVTQPAHVNIDQIIVTPTDQANVTKVYRR